MLSIYNNYEQLRVLGPSFSKIAVLRVRNRFRLLVYSSRGFVLSAYLRDWFARAPIPRGNVQLAVDVDPLSFL